MGTHRESRELSPSTGLKDAVRSAVTVLDETGARYALCGGAALPVWGHERGTRDVDFIVATGPSDGMIERIVACLREIDAPDGGR